MRSASLTLAMIRTIDKQRDCRRRSPELDDRIMAKVNEALRISLGLIEF